MNTASNLNDTLPHQTTLDYPLMSPICATLIYHPIVPPHRVTSASPCWCRGGHSHRVTAPWVSWTRHRLKTHPFLPSALSNIQLIQLFLYILQSNKFLFCNNKIRCTLAIKTKKYCYVVVTWHIMCRLPVTPKHKLMKYKYIYTYSHVESRNRCCQYNLFDNIIYLSMDLTMDWGNV